MYLKHPEGIQRPWAESIGLRRSTTDLLQAWITRPELGYAFNIVVESTQALDAITLESLVNNITNQNYSSKITRTRIHGMPVFEESWRVNYAAWSEPQFHEALKPSQGVPRVLPTSNIAAQVGRMPAQFDSPKIWTDSQTQSGDVLLGWTACAKAHPVVLPVRDRMAHTAILGASGTGKSSLMLQMIASDLSNPAKLGLAVIDPHGTLFEDVLKLIPKSRLSDLVLVDVNCKQHVVSISPMGMTHDVNDRLHVKFMVNALAEMIDLLFETKDSTGPMMRSNIRNMLELVTWMPEGAGAIGYAARLLDDSEFRDYLLAKCGDDSLRKRWKSMLRSASSEQGWDTWVPYLRARFDLFQSPLMLRHLSSPRPTINLMDCVKQGKVVLFRLNESDLGVSEARIFGNMAMNQLYLGARMAAQGKTVEQIRPFHLYIDEAASMVSPATINLWPQARKFGLSLTTANQNISQLKDVTHGSLADSLLANTATKLCFRLNTKDAHFVDEYFKPEISPTQLQRLPTLHAAASISSHGEILPAFVMKVGRPKTSSDVCTSQEIQQQQACHSMPLPEVIELLV